MDGAGGFALCQKGDGPTRTRGRGDPVLSQGEHGLSCLKPVGELLDDNSSEVLTAPKPRAALLRSIKRHLEIHDPERASLRSAARAAIATADARPHPSRRAGIADDPAGRLTARIKLSRAANAPVAT